MSGVTAQAKTAAAQAVAATTVSVDDAFERAKSLHQQGQLDAAHALYERILQAVPGHAAACNALGMLHHQRGASAEAVACIERAMRLAPDDAGYANNLGNVHLECDRLEPAIACYRRALALVPDWPMALNNLGHALKQAGALDEACEVLHQALRLDPGFVRVHVNLGLVAQAQERYDAALGHYEQALGLDPGLADVRTLLGRLYLKLRRPDDAAAVYRRWLELDPAQPVARHMLAACSGDWTPPRADDAYVERTFDDFAESFDRQLTGKLGYCAPQLCAERVARWLGRPAGSLELLDAGCGTGLCGPLLAPWARRLHGVDLSRGMLERAHLTGAYHALYKAELTEFLRQAPAQWDLIVSADTLCYFGDLAELFAAAAASLKPRAVFVFTVEALPHADERDFVLAPHGRYAHHARHLHGQLVAQGFELLEFASAVLRQEGGRPVEGWVVAARSAGLPGVDAPTPH